MTSFHSDNRWIERSAHRHWLQAESLDLLEFYRGACLAGGGFAALDRSGRPAATTADTLITARLTHCYALAHIQGVPGAAALAEHGLIGLRDILRDSEHDGWFAHQPHEGFDDSKQCYIQVFVALGAASALAADIRGAHALLEQVLQILETYFWSGDEQAYRDVWDRDWSAAADYRGANANMHATELCLTLADLLADNSWRRRALAIAERLVHQMAGRNHWHVIEHFDSQWRLLPDYNRDLPDDGFKPFGFTPGHGLEWARLLLHLEAGLQAAGDQPPMWLADDAQALFKAAITDGWQSDDVPGLVYTLDWQRRPASSRRRHWVHAEAIAAAAALRQRTGDPVYEQWYRRLWDLTRDVFIDDAAGSWHQELDANLDDYPGEGHLKPDLYHAYQATLLPRLPLTPMLPAAVGHL